MNAYSYSDVVTILLWADSDALDIADQALDALSSDSFILGRFFS